MILLTAELEAALAANGRKRAENPDFDPTPVCKLFTPDAAATWLLFWSYPGDPDLVYAVSDLGLGIAEPGDIWMPEIRALRGRLGLPVERDLLFESKKPLSAIARDSAKAGHIVA